MKPKKNRYLAATALAAALAAPTLSAQVFPAPQGINLNLTGEIIQSPVIHEPSLNGVGWLATGGNLANRIVPVGQFTGYEDDGTAIPALDLIPLKPASVTVGTTVITPSGSVGIGVASPLAPLHVGSPTGSLVYGGQFASYNYTSAALFKQAAGAAQTAAVSLISEGAIATKANIYSAGNIYAVINMAFSDQRIKDVTGVSNSSNDLKTLQGIEIADYTMKDKVAYGNKGFKKVIAQQVEKVFPQAVNLTVNFIPNVMKLAEVSAENGALRVTLPENADLKAGDLVRFINQQGAREEVCVDAVEGKALSVKLANVKAGDKVFVYGKQVDDFRAVDYEAISMLNVSATQELAKKVSALETENAELKKLAAEMQDLKALVAALEGKSNGTVTVSLTK